MIMKAHTEFGFRMCHVRTFYVLSHLALTTTLLDGHPYDPPFTDKGTKAQRG